MGDILAGNVTTPCRRVPRPTTAGAVCVADLRDTFMLVKAWVAEADWQQIPPPSGQLLLPVLLYAWRAFPGGMKEW